MLSDHYSESRPHTSTDIHPNRRQHYHNIDPLANFAPWEDEEGVDYTSSHSLTLLGFKAVAARPYTALNKGASFANPVDETEEFIQNTTSETIKKENRKEYRKQATVSEYSHKREQRQTSQRFSTDFETNNPTTPKILALASNNPSQRDNNTATPKPVTKVYRGIQRNNQQAYMKERHLSEQYLGLERAKSQEQDPSSIIQNKVNLPFNSLLDKAKSFTAKPVETSQIPGVMGQNNFYILDTNTGPGAIDPNISTNGSFILVQQEENNVNAKKPKTASLSCRVSPKFAHNIEISKSRPTKLYIQNSVFLDTKVSTVENNETIEGIASPTEDAQSSKDDIKQKKVRGFKKEFVPMKLSTAVVSSKGLKIVNRTMSGNSTNNKPQNLTNLIQLNNMTRIEGDKKEDYTIDSDNQYTSFNSQSMRPATTKNSPAVKWFGKSYRGEDDIPGTTYVPSMLDCYKKNRKKYLRPSSNAIQEVPQKHQTTTFDDLYKISQIPLLGNLRKMLDNKGKSSSSISVRPKTIAISVSPPPERAKHFISNTNIKIGDSILSDQDINQSNLRGKLEACLRQKMSNSGVIASNKKKGDIFEERPMSKQDNGKKGTGKYPGHSPRKLKRPSAGMQMFMRSWK